jgi:hypothetical protein
VATADETLGGIASSRSVGAEAQTVPDQGRKYTAGFENVFPDREDAIPPRAMQKSMCHRRVLRRRLRLLEHEDDRHQPQADQR